jgi:hypothetical protein
MLILGAWSHAPLPRLWLQLCVIPLYIGYPHFYLHQIMRDEIHSEEDIRSTLEAAILPVVSRNPPLPDGHIEELRSIVWKDSLVEMELDAPR